MTDEFRVGTKFPSSSSLSPSIIDFHLHAYTHIHIFITYEKKSAVHTHTRTTRLFQTTSIVIHWRQAIVARKEEKKINFKVASFAFFFFFFSSFFPICLYIHINMLHKYTHVKKLLPVYCSCSLLFNVLLLLLPPPLLAGQRFIRRRGKRKRKEKLWVYICLCVRTKRTSG